MIGMLPERILYMSSHASLPILPCGYFIDRGTTPRATSFLALQEGYPPSGYLIAPFTALIGFVGLLRCSSDPRAEWNRRFAAVPFRNGYRSIGFYVAVLVP